MAKLSKINKFTIDGMLGSGHSLEEISKTIGKPVSMVQGHIDSKIPQSEAIPVPEVKVFTLTALEKELLKNDLHSGRYTMDDLALKYGTDSTTIKVYMTENGLLQQLERNQSVQDGFIHKKHGKGGATVATQMSSILGDEARKVPVNEDTRISRGNVYDLKNKKMRGQ